MNVLLTPELARFVRRKVRSGEYVDANEFVRDLVRERKEREDRRKALTSRIRSGAQGEDEGVIKAVRRGFASVDAGNFVEIRGEKELSRFFRTLREQAHRELTNQRKR
jgi:putative addiction module CopG family antidote